MKTCIKCQKESPHIVSVCGECYHKILEPEYQQLEIVLKQNVIFWKLFTQENAPEKVKDMIREINELQEQLKLVVKRSQANARKND